MKIWLLVPLISIVLAMAMLESIVSGPSANEAIISIRVAQRDLLEAQWAYRAPTPRVINDAEDTLDFAFASLEYKKYAEAILLARRSNELVRRLGGDTASEF